MTWIPSGEADVWIVHVGEEHVALKLAFGGSQRLPNVARGPGSTGYAWPGLSCARCALARRRFPDFGESFHISRVVPEVALSDLTPSAQAALLYQRGLTLRRRCWAAKVDSRGHAARS